MKVFIIQEKAAVNGYFDSVLRFRIRHQSAG